LPQIQKTLVANTVAVLPIDTPVGRVSLTAISGTPAVVYATTDGSAPVVPSDGVEVVGTQQALSAVLGAQLPLNVPLFGDHMAAPTVRLISAGTPVVLVQW
jgi:hypothetical protein